VLCSNVWRLRRISEVIAPRCGKWRLIAKGLLGGCPVKCRDHALPEIGLARTKYRAVRQFRKRGIPAAATPPLLSRPRDQDPGNSSDFFPDPDRSTPPTDSPTRAQRAATRVLASRRRWRKFTAHRHPDAVEAVSLYHAAGCRQRRFVRRSRRLQGAFRGSRPVRTVASCPAAASPGRHSRVLRPCGPETYP
jgi:hypothetical protein